MDRDVAEEKRLLQAQLALVTEKLDRAAAVRRKRTPGLQDSSSMLTSSSTKLPSLEASQQRRSGGLRAPPVRPPPPSKLLEPKVQRGGIGEKARWRTIVSSVDSNLAMLSMPQTVRDREGWYVATRSSKHQLHDRSHNNPLISSGSFLG
mmetsp:Transcript_26326/g.88490  ORF Transcript_26326/g.88490 Transcript_26326/m.88490 type:complete len:149 (-) Transcript_26326:37-483(-)